MLPQDAANGLYTDRYELAMAAAYWRDGRAGEQAVFDYFFRTLPFSGGYAIFAGLSTLLEALQNVYFDDKQLSFLEDDGFDTAFLEYLKDFSFKGNIHAAPEGEVVFPVEPIVRVEASLIEAQVIETLLLNILNFQTLIATKAARCRHAAGHRGLSEFGLRRAQGLGGRWASRAACIGGFDTTSNLDAAYAYSIKAAGTMAHSFVQSYANERDAFRKFAAMHGSQTVLLIDTYDTLHSGLPNAVLIARELAERGESLAGVRLDSGDLAYLARRVREELDAAGFPSVTIVASNQLDEHLIRSLILQDAPIDLFGVGTSIATGAPDAALDGVYKLASIDGRPTLKVSENIAKSTLPDRKQVTRFCDANGAFMADAIHLAEETDIPFIIHPFDPLQRHDIKRWVGNALLVPVVELGRAVIAPSSVSQSAEYVRKRLQSLPSEHRRFEYPHVYKVGLSEPLHSLRDSLLKEIRKDIPS